MSKLLHRARLSGAPLQGLTLVFDTWPALEPELAELLGPWLRSRF